MRLILLRHGMTMANEAHLYCGWTDLPLSERGREALRPLEMDVSRMLLITSGMKRADESMQLLLKLEPQRREAAFKEMNFGAFEMHGYEELKDEPSYQAWIADESGSVPCPGGESSLQFKERVLAAFDALCGEGRDALLICHGGVIAAIMAQLFPGEDKHLYQWQPGHGRGYVLEQSKGVWSYQSL